MGVKVGKAEDRKPKCKPAKTMVFLEFGSTKGLERSYLVFIYEGMLEKES